jgi:hypothetical protein
LIVTDEIARRLPGTGFVQEGKMALEGGGVGGGQLLPAPAPEAKAEPSADADATSITHLALEPLKLDDGDFLRRLFKLVGEGISDPVIQIAEQHSRGIGLFSGPNVSRLDPFYLLKHLLGENNAQGAIQTQRDKKDPFKWYCRALGIADEEDQTKEHQTTLREHIKILIENRNHLAHYDSVDGSPQSPGSASKCFKSAIYVMNKVQRDPPSDASEKLAKLQLQYKQWSTSAQGGGSVPSSDPLPAPPQPGQQER